MKTNSKNTAKTTCIPKKKTSLHWMMSAIAVMPMVSGLITTSHAQTKDEERSFMFERFEHVVLVGKEIPEFHKRGQVTDTQGRSIKGQWIAIDRKNKKVKFRRTDGKEYDIDMANLAPQDRRYAELESGYFWQMDPPPTPIDIIKEDILEFDSMDDTYVRLRCVNPRDPSILYVPKFQINLLTARDRALIKEKTGKDVPVLPRPEPTRASGAWKYPRNVFGHEVPKFTPSYFPATMKLMNKTYSAQEMVDAVRVRTLNSSFIHELYQTTFDEVEADKKKGTKSLAEILKIIGEQPSPATEQKSIKPLIAKHKLSLFEEKTPRDPAQPERFIKGDRSIFAQPGVPIDGELQAFHFMCQFLRMTSNKPKIPHSTLLENTKQSFSGMDYTSNGERVTFPPEQRRKVYHSPDVVAGIEKAHGFKCWKIFIPEKFRNYHKPDDAVGKFHDQLTFELIRKHIRDGKPIYARQKSGKDEIRTNGTQLVITGFQAEPGKPLIMEAIGIKGSIWGNDPYTGDYEITETTISEAGLDTMSVTFLEAASSPTQP